MSDAQLKIVDGPDVGREFSVAGMLVIGRDTSAGIVLEDSEVSRRHASVSTGPSGVEVEDLGSTNGTFVNGEKIEGSHTLSQGDKLRIGTTVLEVSLPVQATKIASVIPEPEDPGATKMASIMSPEEAERAAKAEEAMRHAEPEAEPEDEEATIVPEDKPPAPAPTPTAEQPAAPPPPAPEPAAPAPSAGPPTPPPGPPTPPPGPPPPPPAGFGPPPVAAPQQHAPLPQPGAGQLPVGYQAGPGFQVRNPGAQWALCALVPLYSLIWYYRLCTEIGQWSQGRIHTSPGTSLLAVTLGGFIIVPPWVSIAGTMGRIRQCQQLAGLPPTVSFWGFFGRALLLGYGYKWLTEQLNELAVRRPVQ